MPGGESGGIRIHVYFSTKTYTCTVFISASYEVKECLCDISGAGPRARDQNVRFHHLGQFLSNCKG